MALAEISLRRWTVLGAATLAALAAPIPVSASAGSAPIAAAGASFTGTWSFVGPQPIVGHNHKFKTSNQQWGTESGRVTGIALDPGSAGTAYAASAGGGVWKTTDSGAHWSPTSDSQYTGAIGAIATGPGAAKAPAVVYAGTGENNLCLDCQIGFGVLKSTDGGATWTLLGKPTFTGLYIGGVAVDRSTAGASQRVLVGTNAGLYISNNGGTTWTLNANFASKITLVSGGNRVPNVHDVVEDPSTPARFYATVGNNCRNDAGDVMVSNDSGATWTSTLKGTSTAGGKCSARPSVGVGTGGVAYAVLTTSGGDLDSVRKSTNGGATWTKLPKQPPDYFSGQGWYDNVTAVDPASNDRVVFGGVDLIATSDGGGTYTNIGNVLTGGPVHPDQHAIAFSAARSFYVGDDGGVWTTTDLGGTGKAADWTDRSATLAITQFYSGDALDRTHLLGGSQDNGNPGSFAGTAGNPAPPAFKEYEAGDGTHTAVDASSTTFYTAYPPFLPTKPPDKEEEPGGGIVKGSRGSQFTSTSADPCSKSTDPACGDPRYFVTAFVADPSNISRLFAGTNRVYRTTSGGTPAGSGGWSRISGNVTARTPAAGTTDCFATNSDCITSMATSAGGNIVMTGSFYGAVSLSTNAQAAAPSFTNITGNLPAYDAAHVVAFTPWISGVAFNPSNPSEAWVTVAADTTLGRIWHTTNAGAGGGTAWTNITGNYPQYTATSIVADPNAAGTIYVGGLQGVSVCSTCGGAAAAPAWAAAGTGLPNSEVDALTISRDNSVLLAWTHGRGVWALPRTLRANIPEAPSVGLLPIAAVLGLVAYRVFSRRRQPPPRRRGTAA